MPLTSKRCVPFLRTPARYHRCRFHGTSVRGAGARFLALLLPLLAVAGGALLLAAPALAASEPPPSKIETALPEPRAGETDMDEATFLPLEIPELARSFKDPAIASLAARIAEGQADMRDRRAWYAISLLYAPFDALPPAGWREAALRAGESISIDARRRAAAARRSMTADTTGGGPGAAEGPATPGAPGEPIAQDLLSPLATYSWSSLGPTNYNVGGSDLAQGRASALWVHPTNTNFLLAGFADGGVWKTTNGGTNWTPISDFEASTSIGSIDVLIRTDTTNLSDAIIYVGLGEGNTASASVDGAGVLKSVNGGATWTLQTIPWANPDAATSARFRHSIRRIAIDRNVAGAASVWIAGDGGVYRTVDGGANWSLVTGLPYTGKPGVGGCWPEMPTDFLIDTGSTPSRLYVAYGARSNGSSVAATSCTGIASDVNFRKNNGVYRSTDGGATWSSITGAGSGFPAVPGQVGRITLLQAPSDKKQVYALISCVTNGATTCAGGQFASLGIYRTTDITAASPAWTAGSTTNFCANQGWYNLTGAVDPTNPSKLFVAGLDAYLSTNSGGTISRKSDWTGTGTSYAHADHHHMVYANSTTVFDATDGGIFKGTISGSTVAWTNLNAGGLSTLQFYGIAQHPTTANRIHGGLQDNGEAYTVNGSSWSMTQGGDGGFSATDWTNGEIAYEEYVYGAISRSTTGGASGWSCIQNFGGCAGCGICVPDGQASFIAPLTLDANNPSILYSASKYIYRNSAAPTSSIWTAISPDLAGTTYDYILNIHSAPNGGAPGTLWATTSNGKVWVSADNGANWTDTTKSPLPNNPVLPNRAATWLATHPSNGRQAIVVFSGWNGSGSQPGHVFRTLDGGGTWIDISGALPDEPVFTAAVDPNHPTDVYIGTEFGVYVNSAGWSGSTWTKINSGQLPSVHVHQLEFSRANGRLRAATHGRGIWELNVTCPAFAPPTLAAPAASGCGALVSWTPSGSTGATYNLYRASGACPGGTYAPIATGITTTTYIDTSLSGGLTYSYRATTAEAAGSCESVASSCQAITTSPACPCTLAPAFAGVASVSTPYTTSCNLNLSWSPATQTCGATVPVYNVYRSTSPSFVPAASNRIATCVSGTGFTDTGGLATGTNYYYVVRAEDGSGSGNGPCRGGNEDANFTRAGSAPGGILVPGVFVDGAEGTPLMTMGAPLWSQSASRARSGAKSYFGNGAPTNSCAALTTPTLVLGSAASPSVLSFYSWRDNLEDTYDGGVVEITTNGGAGWAKVQLSPAYPNTFAADAASCADTPQSPAAAGFTGNDSSWQGAYTANLSAWAGLPAQIRFNLGTDPAVTSVGWYVDDIQATNISQAGACAAVPGAAPEVSPASSGLPLLITRSGPGLLLSYQEIAGAGGYNVYEGSLGSWYSHAASATNACGAAASPAGAGRRSTLVTPAAGSRYYLVTAYTSAEGPSGFATSGEIPPASSTCAP